MKSLILFSLFCALSLSLHAEVRLEPIAKGFKRPVWVGCPPQENKHLWIMEQEGRITVIDKATGDKVSTFLDLTRKTKISANERGLLGIAFASDFADSGLFYLNLTNNDGDTEIIRLTTEKDNRLKAEPSSAEILLKIKQPFGNHNGGFIAFGPDNMLYIGMGDGGAANDPVNAGQDMKTLLGKMLRIDVSGDKGYTVPSDNPFGDEIWMCGLRNPWRCSWDAETKDFWIGDVGQNKLEEINIVPAGKGKGMNFGWRLREGSIATPKNDVGGSKPEGATDPIYEYLHDNTPTGGFSVTGGYVYRGSITSMQGYYIFADYNKPHMWAFKESNGKAGELMNLNQVLSDAKPPVKQVSSFGTDNDNELYLTDHATGVIHKFVEKK